MRLLVALAALALASAAPAAARPRAVAALTTRGAAALVRAIAEPRAAAFIASVLPPTSYESALIRISISPRATAIALGDYAVALDPGRASIATLTSNVTITGSYRATLVGGAVLAGECTATFTARVAAPFSSAVEAGRVVPRVPASAVAVAVELTTPVACNGLSGVALDVLANHVFPQHVSALLAEATKAEVVAAAADVAAAAAAAPILMPLDGPFFFHSGVQGTVLGANTSTIRRAGRFKFAVRACGAPGTCDALAARLDGAVVLEDAVEPTDAPRELALLPATALAFDAALMLSDAALASAGAALYRSGLAEAKFPGAVAGLPAILDTTSLGRALGAPGLPEKFGAHKPVALRLALASAPPVSATHGAFASDVPVALDILVGRRPAALALRVGCTVRVALTPHVRAAAGGAVLGGALSWAPDACNATLLYTSVGDVEKVGVLVAALSIVVDDVILPIASKKVAAAAYALPFAEAAIDVEGGVVALVGNFTASA